MAARCGQMVNAAEIARDADINQTQAKDWLTILETLGIIFYLHPYSNNLLKRLVQTVFLRYGSGVLPDEMEQCGNVRMRCYERGHFGKLRGRGNSENLPELWKRAVFVLLS